jgi:hypothetical protein
VLPLWARLHIRIATVRIEKELLKARAWIFYRGVSKKTEKPRKLKKPEKK